MDKIAELEKRIVFLEEKLSMIFDDKQDEAWMKLSEAAKALDCHPQTLRRHIFQSKSFPKTSPYKKGVHWRGATHYQIHVRRWLNATIS